MLASTNTFYKEAFMEMLEYGRDGGSGFCIDILALATTFCFSAPCVS
jgi:hypothetical protein